VELYPRVGRTGQPGQVWAIPFPTEAEASAALERQKRVKERRGYRSAGRSLQTPIAVTERSMTKTARKRLLRDYRRAVRAGDDDSAAACLAGLEHRCDSDDEWREILSATIRILVDAMTRLASVNARHKD
jgi:predicted DNA-binding WGR domain protein